MTIRKSEAQAEASVTKVKLTPAELLAKYRYTGKLTFQFIGKAVDKVLAGATAHSALLSLGVSTRTLRAWQKYAETGEKGPKYQLLFDTLESAEHDCLAQVAANFKNTTIKDGRAGAEFLSRRDKEHWGKTDRVDVDVQLDAGPVLKAIAEAQQRLALQGITPEETDYSVTDDDTEGQTETD